jgi:hypothetical protein
MTSVTHNFYVMKWFLLIYLIILAILKRFCSVKKIVMNNYMHLRNSKKFGSTQFVHSKTFKVAEYTKKIILWN